MGVNKLRPQIQLSLREYIDVWSGIAFEHYQQAVSDEVLFDALQLDEEQTARFPLEYGTTLLVLAALSFKFKPKLTSEKYQTKICERMADSLFAHILKDADEETLTQCLTYFLTKLGIFGRFCVGCYSKSASARQKDIIGFARYLLSQLGVEAEEERQIKALERLGVLLATANESFLKLVANSAQDAIRFDGKPSFVVQK